MSSTTMIVQDVKRLILLCFDLANPSSRNDIMPLTLLWRIVDFCRQGTHPHTKVSLCNEVHKQRIVVLCHNKDGLIHTALKSYL